jgi:uncharacterized iron-regulated membrane protein
LKNENLCHQREQYVIGIAFIKAPSLICTIFLLISCLTGLPLIFHDEIDQMVSPSTSSQPPIEIPHIPLSAFVASAQGEYPKMHPIFVMIGDDEPEV